MKFRIGNIKIDFKCEDKVFNEIVKPYIHSFPDAETDVNISIVFKETIKIPNVQKIGDTPTTTWFENDNDYFVCGIKDELGDFVYCAKYSKDFKKIKIDLFDFEKVCKSPAPLLVKNVLEMVLKPVVINFDGINIHSSSISYENNGIIFSAPSGTGKSTHTSLWLKNYPKTEIINDDMPLIQEIDGEFMLCGTPWAGTSGINKNKIVPLKGIVFLTRDSKNTIMKLSSVMVLKYLYGEICLFPPRDVSDRQYDILDRLITKVPAYLLGCNISDEAVEIVKNKLGL